MAEHPPDAPRQPYASLQAGRVHANPTLRFGRDTRAWTLRACRAHTLRAPGYSTPTLCCDQGYAPAYLRARSIHADRVPAALTCRGDLRGRPGLLAYTY